ncbi:MAG: Eco57I restriction-modification methylase domain-containing protein [Treponemataceae bacterium]
MLVNNQSYIYFASIQDIRGSEIVGGKFNKNEDVLNIDWDLIIIDEAHEGTKTDLGIKVFDRCIKENTRILHLSGTPFNLMDDFKEDEIFTWDYVMEQQAKNDWDMLHFGDPNPYECLPRMNIFTYHLGKLFADYADTDIAFNFKEFFRVDEKGNFIHEMHIKQFLDMLVKDDAESNYPFSTEEYRDNFRHSLWMIPGVKEAKALSNLLQKHPVFGLFEIVNVAGDGDEEVDSTDALGAVEKAITDKPNETYTITLSCGRLTTGVSVKAWTACFMLAGSYNTAASAYMQTIFRVQTPATINGAIKKECFVFDFAPDRTLKVIAEAARISSKAGKTTEDDRIVLENFINFCPILGFNGSKMISYDAPSMLEQLKKVYVERVINNGFEDSYLYSDKLMQLDNIDLQEFESLKKVIGTTKSMAKTNEIIINNQGLNEQEFEQLRNIQNEKRENPTIELTEEQKALLEKQEKAKKNRDAAISILRGISIRMPLLIYGAELSQELNFKNSDAQTEEELTIDTFAKKIDDQSWNEFMPKGVSKETFESFKKYYDPDIFRAAGKRIREMAKAADHLSIEERIHRISNIFSTFRNPDKETVLTPWKVVNRHLSDCLGGWNFYDNEYTTTLETPRFVEHAGITQNVYKKTSKILEINSKSGLYPLYCAYSIYKQREKLEIGINPTKEMQMHLWHKVLAENIYVICKTPMAKSITKRTLAGFTNAPINALYFEDLVNQLKNKSQAFIDKVNGGKYWNKKESLMKFDAIVGNPPYNVIDGGHGSSALPVYNTFVEIAKKLEPIYLSMIMPSRWMTGGKGLNNFRENMLNDKHIKILHDYLDSSDCFPSVQIEGGICYFLWDLNTEGKCKIYSHLIDKSVSCAEMFLNKNSTDILIRDVTIVSILNKIVLTEENSFEKYVLPRNPFGISNEILDKCIENSKPDTYKILGRFDNKRGIKFLSNKSITIKNDNLVNEWKVFVSKADGAAGQIGNPIPARIIGKAEIGEPNMICSETFLTIGAFNSKQITQNVIIFMATKFFRFMVGIRKNKNMTRDTYKFVPLQDFTKKSDIDWSKTIPEIDKQLYAKYNLNTDEISFIEKMIKSME